MVEPFSAEELLVVDDDVGVNIGEKASVVVDANKAASGKAATFILIKVTVLKIFVSPDQDMGIPGAER